MKESRKSRGGGLGAIRSRWSQGGMGRGLEERGRLDQEHPVCPGQSSELNARDSRRKMVSLPVYRMMMCIANHTCELQDQPCTLQLRDPGQVTIPL